MHYFFHFTTAEVKTHFGRHCLRVRDGLTGRGGIRTHGGFPHARFRVECLKPDSATLPWKEKKTPNVQRPTLNVQRKPSFDIVIVFWAFGILHWLFASDFDIRIGNFVITSKLWPGQVKDAPGEGRSPAEKCYNFMLAMPVPGAACCMSNRTATLLLVVDWYSQVVSPAVHHYSHIIRNLNPPLPP
jgi:hypothetical protein